MGRASNPRIPGATQAGLTVAITVFFQADSNRRAGRFRPPRANHRHPILQALVLAEAGSSRTPKAFSGSPAFEAGTVATSVCASMSLVENKGIEPFCNPACKAGDHAKQSRSPKLVLPAWTRTDDPSLTRGVLYHLSYESEIWCVLMDSNHRVFWNPGYSRAHSTALPSTRILHPLDLATAWGVPHALAWSRTTQCRPCSRRCATFAFSAQSPGPMERAARLELAASTVGRLSSTN